MDKQDRKEITILGNEQKHLREDLNEMKKTVLSELKDVKEILLGDGKETQGIVPRLKKVEEVNGIGNVSIMDKLKLNKLNISNLAATFTAILLWVENLFNRGMGLSN